MDPSPSIRVWLTHSNSSNPTEDFRPQRNDIILVYNPDTLFRGITAIYGYSSGTQGYKLNVFSTAIREPELIRAFGDNNQILNITNSGTELLLSGDDWQTLRNLILNANPDLTTTIETLEARQQKLLEIAEIEAIIFDATRTAIQIFHPSNISKILNYMDSTLRKNVIAQMGKSIGEEITKGLMQNDLALPVNSIAGLSSLQGRMVDGYRKNYREADAIENDFTNPGFELSKVNGRVPDDMARKMAILSDNQSGRELTLYMAHRVASGSEDLAASDLIYVNEEHCSIIFVQYKRLSEQNTVALDSDDKDQLRDLLDICKRQSDGCTNCPNGVYKQDHLLRLNDCPTLYKFVNFECRISPESKSMEGDYIQSCLVDRLINESGSKRRKEILSRAIPHGSFIGLMRRIQIGSRSESYDELTEAMLEKMDAVVAIERRVKQPKAQRQKA